MAAARKHALILSAGALVLAACAEIYAQDSDGTTETAATGDAMAADEIAAASREETEPPFGGPENVAYAETLWTALEEAELVGDDTIMAVPYEGQEPHGAILITLEDEVTVEGHSGLALVKKNYLGEDVSVDNVANDPDQYLDSVTVMYMREEGYDPDHQNWFWSKHNPDGSLQTNPKDMQLAGRVAKGAAQGCIACHQGAPGDDYVFNHDRLTMQ